MTFSPLRRFFPHAAAILVLGLGGALAAQTPAAPPPANPAGHANRPATIAGILGTPAERGVEKAVWLAARTDGRDGFGTAEDPRDASTAEKLDAIFPALPAGVTIHLAPGIYDTGGVTVSTRTSGVILKSGSRLVGAGAERTTIRLRAETIPAGTYGVATAPARRDLITSLDDTGGAHVSDLTVDANRANQGGFTSGSAETLTYYLNLSGAHCSIRNCVVRGGWNLSPTAETFPVIIGSNTGTAVAPAVGIIDGVICELYENPAGGCTMINLAAADPARITGKIVNTVIRDRRSGAYSRNQAAGCAGWQGVEIAGNSWDGVFCGVYTDSFSYSDVTIRNNFIRVRADPRGFAGFGVGAGGGSPFTWDGWKITDNSFVISRNANALRLSGNCANFTFARNEVRFDPASADGPVGPAMIGVAGLRNTNLRVEANRLDSAGPIAGITYGEESTAAALAWSTNNRRFDGTAIPGLREDLGAKGSGTTQTVAASAIDWSLGATFTKTLGADTAFTFLNAVDGGTIVVAVTNTTGNHAVTWPAVKWPGGAVPRQTRGEKTDIYTFTRVDGVIYGTASQNY